MAAIIFSGDRLRSLRAAIRLNTAATIASGAVDPTLVAPGLILSPGSLYLSTSTGKLYVKKTTSADDINFDTIPQLTADLSADKIVITNASGDIVTDAELSYDSATDTFTVVNVQATDVNVSSLTASQPVKTDASKNLVSGLIVDADVDPSAAIALSKLSSLTASRALESDGSGVIAASAVTSTELGYVSGVTSAIQTQINGKVSKAGDSMTGNLVMGGNLVTGVGSPSADGDAANKGYVDSAINGLKWKDSVRLVSLSNLALSGNPTIDSVLTVDGDRVLLVGQTDPIENGIYIVDNTAWTRSLDLAAGADATGTAVFVEEGTVYADTGHVCTSNGAIVGTDALAFVQFTGAGQIIAGVGLAKSGNTLDVNLGAGISQLPTDQVGVDLYSTSGLMLTLDGTTPSTDEDAQLSLLIDGTTLSKSASGVKVADAGITDTQVSASAAIAYSKLALSDSIVNADINSAAAIAYSKLNLSASVVDADISATAAIAYSKLDLAGSIVDADVNAAAAIAYSKLALSDSIVNADIAAAAAIVYSKLSLADSIVNADIAAAAAIAYSKLDLAASIVNADISASAAIAYSKLDIAGSIVNADINAAAAIDYSKLNLSASIVNADVSASAAIAYSKLDLVDSIVNADIAPAAAIAYSKLSLSDSILNADINSAAAIAYSKLDLSASIVDADIAAAAAIARTKLADATANTFAVNDSAGELAELAVTANRAVVTDAVGLPLASATTDVELGYVSGVTSAIQDQIDGKVSKAGDTMTGALNLGTFQINDLADPTLAQDAATKAYVDSRGVVESSDLTLTAAASITASSTAPHQVIVVQGNAAGVTTIAAAPFGTGTFTAGQLITLVGNSSANVVRLANSDAAKGALLNGSVELGYGDSITLAYSAVQDRFIEVSRNS